MQNGYWVFWAYLIENKVTNTALICLASSNGNTASNLVGNSATGNAVNLAGNPALSNDLNCPNIKDEIDTHISKEKNELHHINKSIKSKNLTDLLKDISC